MQDGDYFRFTKRMKDQNSRIDIVSLENLRKWTCASKLHLRSLFFSRSQRSSTSALLVSHSSQGSQEIQAHLVTMFSTFLLYTLILSLTNAKYYSSSYFLNIYVPDDTICNVMDYGAKGDGKTDDTPAACFPTENESGIRLTELP